MVVVVGEIKTRLDTCCLVVILTFSVSLIISHFNGREVYCLIKTK
jgi:hypothetical protein